MSGASLMSKLQGSYAPSPPHPHRLALPPHLPLSTYLPTPSMFPMPPGPQVHDHIQAARSFHSQIVFPSLPNCPHHLCFPYPTPAPHMPTHHVLVHSHVQALRFSDPSPSLPSPSCLASPPIQTRLLPSPTTSGSTLMSRHMTMYELGVPGTQPLRTVTFGNACMMEEGTRRGAGHQGKERLGLG